MQFSIPLLRAPRGMALGFFLAVVGASGLTGAEAPPHPVKPLLWEVSGRGLKKPAYLFGTIHLGMPPINTLHPAAQKAFDAAEALYTEVSMKPEDQLAIVGEMMRKDGMTLKQSIGDKLHDQVEAELKLINPALDSVPFQGLKTWTVAMALPLLPFQLQGGRALDQILWDRATKAGKSTAGLEQAKDQIAIFDELTEAEQTIFLSETLRLLGEDRAAQRDTTGETVAAYVAGDPAAVHALLERSFREIKKSPHRKLGERLMKRLLTDRDITMAGAIDAHLQAMPATGHFFAVGAGHFVSPTSIRQHLEKLGYTITPLGH